MSFIVIDGIDGTGKTTIAKYIAEKINGVYIPIFGAGPIGKEVRNSFLTEKAILENKESYHLVAAAIVESFYMYVLPLLKEGKNVVVDRFMASMYAYQIHSHPKDNLYNSYWNLYQNILKSATPDLYIWMNADLDICLARSKERGSLDHYDNSTLEAKNKLIEGYSYFFKNQILPNSVIVDANSPLSEVKKDIDLLLKEFEIITGDD